MKKSTLSWRKWHLLRARNELRRAGRSRLGWGYSDFNSPSKRRISLVQIWQGGDPEWALCLHPPELPPDPICLEDNRDETFKLFRKMRTAFDHALKERVTFVARPKTKNGRPRIPTYLDMSTVSRISTAAAVMFAAEYDRMRMLQGVIPPTVELDKWTDPVFLKLFQMGFFEITGHTPINSDKITESVGSLSMRIVRSSTADDLRVVDLALQELFLFMDAAGTSRDKIIIEFLTALSEAMTNVTNHAYMSEIEFQKPYVPCFWVAATAHKIDRTITIVVYDQGHTIPATYPRMERLEKVMRFLSRTVGRAQERYGDDGTYIRAAMRFGGSRTDQRHRGRGFPQMFATLQKIGKGTLSVYSRGGWCKRSSEGKMRSGYVAEAISGTLVEWTVAIP